MGTSQKGFSGDNMSNSFVLSITVIPIFMGTGIYVQ